MMLALSMMVNAFAADESVNYALAYEEGVPTSVTGVSRTYAVRATGGSRITVKSNRFDVDIVSAYIYARGVNYGTTPKIIDGTGTYYLNYTGTTVPKAGISVTVSMVLNEYVDSESVYASGTINTNL